MELTELGALGSSPGTYALVCRTMCRAEIAVGRLGALAIREGYYVYIGSAFGPGGLHARVAHHLRGSRKRHWHADYLWPALRIGEIWYSDEPIRREHDWARVFAGMSGCSIPLRRFGASDCRCEAHLLFFARLPSVRAFRARLVALIPTHRSVRRAR